jgi:methionyl-tRNA formyltransferase
MLINRLSRSEEQEELTKIDEKSSHKYYTQNNFSDSYILVGSDFAYGLECTRAILQNGINIGAIGGLTAELIVESAALKSFNPKIVVSSREKPWEEPHFFEATIGTEKIGISCGLDSIIPPDFLATRFCINTHPSALPFNRGSHQSFWAIMNETLGGGSIHVVTQEVDEGPILVQEVFEIPEDMTSFDLQKKQLTICIELLRKNIKEICLGSLNPVNQIGGSSHYKKEILSASTLRVGEKIEVSELFKLIKATYNKGNGFWIETEGARYQIVVGDVKSNKL